MQPNPGGIPSPPSTFIFEYIRSIDGGAGMRYVMRIFDTPLLEFEASYGEGLQAG